jgi:TonB-dependent starch-binding outer membrane protein SusC
MKKILTIMKKHLKLLHPKAMSATLLLLLMFFSQVQANDNQQQKITISFQKTSIKEILKEIERQTDYRFFYQTDQIDVQKKVDLELSAATVPGVLNELFRGSNVYYEINGKRILLKNNNHLEKKSINSTIQEITLLGRRGFDLPSVQDFVVKGRVTGEGNEPLPGVNILEKGTLNGTITNLDGSYTLSVSNGNAILVFSFIGMTTEEIALGGRSRIDVKLQTDIKALQEVVVVGYGTVKKSDLTGSVAQVNEEQIKAMPIVALDRAIQGRAPGVHVTQNSARPGGPTTIRIRGTGSVTAGNEPLYVIDGYPIGDLNSINPNDIESIEILKDASATAIYGSRGSNGVILVTTKRGKAGQQAVSFESFYGVQSVTRKIPLLNSQQYAEFINEARVNGGGQPYFDGSGPDRPLPSQLGEGTDWQDKIFRNAPIQNYQLALSGGNNKTRYAISGNLYNQDGVVVNSNFKRYTLRTNLDHEVSSRIKVGLSIQGAFTDETRVRVEGGGQQSAGATNAALNYPPVFPVYNPNGTYFRNMGTLNGRQVDNPLGIANENKNKIYGSRILTNAFVDIKITDDLVFRSSLGANISNWKNNWYATRQTNLGQSMNGDATVSSGMDLNWLNENVLSYTKTLNEKHNISGVLGYTAQASYGEFFTANARNFSDDFALYHNLGAGSTLRAPSSGASEWGLISYLARANYGYDNRYLFTFTARADGSSRFGSNRKYGFFPSGAVAWRAINEDFMKTQSLFSDLKVRATYGFTGNQEIGNYQFLSSIMPVTSSLGGTLIVGGAQNRVGNQDLGWEKNSQLDIGVDFGILKNKIQVTADYYIKTTSDLLIQVNIPQSSGFSNSLQNIGSVENRGLELAINTVNVERSDFQWFTEFNVSFNKNKVLSIDNDRTELIQGSFENVNSYNITRVGEPLGSFYGRIVDGIFQTQEEINNSAQKNARPGDFKFRDINGDGVINDSDRTIIGNPNPKFFGGFNNTFKFKNFDLNIFLQGTFGNDIMNFQRFETLNLNGQNNQSTEVLNRWTPSNPSNTIPRANIGGGQRIFSTFHMEDGSFVRVRNISLGYTIPSSLSQKLRINTSRVYVSGQNLFTFTKYSGYDPEVNFFGSGSINQGVDFGSFPNAKTLLVGLNLKF